MLKSACGMTAGAEALARELRVQQQWEAFARVACLVLPSGLRAAAALWVGHAALHTGAPRIQCNAESHEYQLWHLHLFDGERRPRPWTRLSPSEPESHARLPQRASS